MSDIRGIYSRAADEAVTEGERAGLWTVYSYYELRRGEAGTYAVAPRNVPKERVHKVRRENGGSMYAAEVAVHVTPDIDLRRVRRGVGHAVDRKNIEVFTNIPHFYMPLKEYPSLFDEFARLGDRVEIDQKAWMHWLHKYGVLGARGLLSSPGRALPRNTETDWFPNFREEALLASRTLRLFEAVTVPDGPDLDTIRALLPEQYRRHADDSRDGAQSAALQAVRDTVEAKVHAECYASMIQRDSGWDRRKHVSPFLREWDCRSLLGSMWLQFMWLATMNGLRYCRAPGCARHISPYARSDKVTCSDKCRQDYHRSRKSTP